MAQKGTERVNKNAQNNNKGTKRHKMTQNENEKAKNSTELLKRLKKVIKWSEAQNGAEWHKSYILCRFVCLLSFCAFLLTLI